MKKLPDALQHKIERRPLAKLVPYAKNARTHSSEQISQIAGSIREWGWTFPILIDEKNGIIAGHGRALAAKELGANDVPVIVAKGWTAEQKRAYIGRGNYHYRHANYCDVAIRRWESFTGNKATKEASGEGALRK